MALTALDRKTALVVVDLQRGIFSLPLVHPTAIIVERASRLANAFRASGRLVVLVNSIGAATRRADAGTMNLPQRSDSAELMPELRPGASDIRVTKENWSAFAGTTLDYELRRRGVTQVALCGVATSIAVESTARSAYDHGYHVTLVVDAMSDVLAEAHEHSVGTIFPRLGETGASDVLLALLDERRAH